jgi:hypothetical protein
MANVQGQSAGQATRQRSAATALLLSCTVGLLALPSAVLAFSTRFDGSAEPVAAPVADETFHPATVDPRLSRSIAVRTLSQGKTFRFTPAGNGARADRSVTVAVRLDADSARSLRITPQLAVSELPSTGSALRIAPSAYSLGSSRGYRSFASGAAAVPTLAARGDIPDLASFRPSPGPRGTPSRFSPQIELDQSAPAGRSPRTFDGDGEQRVDVGGSYRLSRNLNVTAGVRVQTERDRLVPLTDGRQDSQAVYVGTQFRF